MHLRFKIFYTKRLQLLPNKNLKLGIQKNVFNWFAYSYHLSNTANLNTI